VTADLFRKHLQALQEVTEIVTLQDVLEESGGRRAESNTRPAVAITFDDDLASHMSEALPALRHFQAPATFFLSGRALHADESYWFQYLEALLIARGLRQTAALLGMPDAQPGAVLAACEGSAQARKRIRELARDLAVPDLLQPSEMASLAAAGMTVGFHTVDHEILPTLDDQHLHDALSRGREELSAASGADVRYFAYPHGKTNGRVSAAVRAAGFDAAFTGHPRPLRDTDDRHRVGRWEPGPLNVDELILKLAVRLHRAAPIDSNERR
jgi:peptidoglycan/xylan/chitin deacetylase (PgdA/CDA1 family)